MAVWRAYFPYGRRSLPRGYLDTPRWQSESAEFSASAHGEEVEKILMICLLHDRPLGLHVADPAAAATGVEEDGALAAAATAAIIVLALRGTCQRVWI